MQLTKFTDFSLRVLLYLAVNDETKATVAVLAEQLQASQNHMVKVVNRLAHLGYVETTRGSGGGVRLARAPEGIRLGQVIRDTESNLNMVDCSSPPCPVANGCRLVPILAESVNLFLDNLDRYTLQDLIKDNPPLHTTLRVVGG